MKYFLLHIIYDPNYTLLTISNTCSNTKFILSHKRKQCQFVKINSSPKLSVSGNAWNNLICDFRRHSLHHFTLTIDFKSKFLDIALSIQLSTFLIHVFKNFELYTKRLPII